MFASVSLSSVSSVKKFHSGKFINNRNLFLTVLDAGMYCQTLSYEDLFLDLEISSSCWLSPHGNRGDISAFSWNLCGPSSSQSYPPAYCPTISRLQPMTFSDHSTTCYSLWISLLWEIWVDWGMAAKLIEHYFWVCFQKRLACGSVNLGVAPSSM